MNTLVHPRNITRADLEWWLELAPTLTWTFAKTYAKTAPHSYVVAGKTAGMTTDDYVRGAAVIRTFGQPAKYYSMTNIYLTSADGSLKWWTMNKHTSDTHLINQASTERVYGEQDAPPTFSGRQSIYDEIATDYDRLRSPANGDAKTGLLSILVDLTDVLGHRPTVLDVGCGTGAVLDLGVTTSDRYTGIDPSQAMLNELLVKNDRRRLAGIFPTTMENAVEALPGHSFDLVVAAFGSASYVQIDALRQLTRMSARATVLMAYTHDFLPNYYADHPGARPRGGGLFELGAELGILVQRIGQFDVLTIRRQGAVS